MARTPSKVDQSKFKPELRHILWMRLGNRLCGPVFPFSENYFSNLPVFFVFLAGAQYYRLGHWRLWRMQRRGVVFFSSFFVRKRRVCISSMDKRQQQNNEGRLKRRGDEKPSSAHCPPPLNTLLSAAPSSVTPNTQNRRYRPTWGKWGGRGGHIGPDPTGQKWLQHDVTLLRHHSRP